MLGLDLARRVARGAIRAPFLPRALGGPLPVNDRGDELDPQLHLLLTIHQRAQLPRIDEVGVLRARTDFRTQTRLIDVPAAPIHRVEDRRIDGPGGELALRVYTPRRGLGRAPALLYLHGGGFVIGDLESHDGICRFLADRAEVIVVALDYRLAPEHPFPAAVEDCLAAFRWLHASADALGVDPDRIAVGGDSAGGNLSAVLSQQLLYDGGPCPAFQLLIYPSTDLTRSFDSHRRFASGFFLERPLMDWFAANYLSEVGQETDPRGSPIVTRELAGLPPAHVVVAGFDPLRDEGEAYAHALMAAGVPATLRCYGSLIHGFASMGGVIDAARWALTDMASALAGSLRR